ncbi:MAG: hypothetical protein ACFFCW_00380 [Candidatus Hodarchaeota archaeon]
MANSTGTNPIRMEAAGTVWDGQPRSVRLVQWVDDNGDIVDDSTAVLTINGCTLTAKLQLEANISNYGVVVWQIGPFNPGLPVSSFVVTTLGTGHLHIWCD